MLGAVALLPEGCCTAKLLHGLHLCSLDGSVLLLEHVLRGPGVSCAGQSYLGSPPDAVSASSWESRRAGVRASQKTYLKLVLFLGSRAGGRAAVLLEAYIAAVPPCPRCVAALLCVLV